MNDGSKLTEKFHLKTPTQVVSLDNVDHILAVASSDPVINMLPSSDRHMQLTDFSWSPLTDKILSFFTRCTNLI